MVYLAMQSCTSGRNAFFTGMYPLRTGMIQPQIPGNPTYLQPGTPAIPKFLLDLGYTTGFQLVRRSAGRAEHGVCLRRNGHDTHGPGVVASGAGDVSHISTDAVTLQLQPGSGHRGDQVIQEPKTHPPIGRLGFESYIEYPRGGLKPTIWVRS